MKVGNLHLQSFMNPAMWQYTINTGETYNFSQKTFDKQLHSAVQSISDLAGSDSITLQPLPEPFNSHAILLMADIGFASFDLYREHDLVSANSVCWSESIQQSVWEAVERQYLALARQYGRLLILPHKPTAECPWLVTLTVHNPNSLAPWFNDFQQCLSLALVEAERANAG